MSKLFDPMPQTTGLEPGEAVNKLKEAAPEVPIPLSIRAVKNLERFERVEHDKAAGRLGTRLTRR